MSYYEIFKTQTGKFGWRLDPKKYGKKRGLKLFGSADTFEQAEQQANDQLRVSSMGGGKVSQS